MISTRLFCHMRPWQEAAAKHGKETDVQFVTCQSVELEVIPMWDDRLV